MFTFLSGITTKKPFDVEDWLRACAIEGVIELIAAILWAIFSGHSSDSASVVLFAAGLFGGAKKVLVLTVDEDNEPVDLESKVPVLSGRIVMKEGVPPLGTEAFAEYLEYAHRRLNPFLFEEEEGEE